MHTPFDHSDSLQREFDGTSDRAVAIVAGAFLDELLQELLCEFFVDQPASENKKLFEGTGPLATFSSKIEIAFRVGLVSKGEHRSLHTIRGIRNEFAHVLGDVSFETQSIRARCGNIEAPVSMVSPRSVPLSQSGEEPPLPTIAKADSNQPRAVFQEAVLTLMHSLAARVAEAGRIRRTSPADFKEAHEPADSVLTRLEGLLEHYEELSRNVNLSAEEKTLIGKDVEAYGLMVRVQRFCVQQIKRAHALLPR